MGISQQIGSSSLSKPGVCTSSTRPATPYEGQMIYETDTDKVLVYNGSAWVIPNSPAQNPQGLELITTCTATSTGSGGSYVAATASGGVVTVGTINTSVTVSSAFSSTYDNYKIIVAGGVASASGDNLGLGLGSTTTGYRNSLIGVTSAGASSVSYDNNTNTRWIWAGGIDTTGVFANIELFNPFLSVVTFADMGMVRAGANGHWKCYGTLANSTSYTAFTITPASGTLTGGTIRVYGYRNS